MDLSWQHPSLEVQHGEGETVLVLGIGNSHLICCSFAWLSSTMKETESVNASSSLAAGLVSENAHLHFPPGLSQLGSNLPTWSLDTNRYERDPKTSVGCSN
jgi:hypothetical protein